MITSFSNNKVKQIVLLNNNKKERKKTGLYIVEGSKMFEEAPEEMIKEVYLSEQYLSLEHNKKILEKLEKVGYETVSEEVFLKISDTKTPQGILCVIKQPKYEMKQLLQGKAPLLMVLEDLQDPGNLGTIFRTGEGAGITGVIMTRDTVDIFNPKTIRATMGSIYRVPFFYTEDLDGIIADLHNAGVNLYAAHLAGKEYYDGFDLKKPTAFLIGNEGNGLKKATADKADSYLKIPMEGKVESLNAGIASALLMYEAHRQRSLHNLKP